eukprot:scaffold5385_cov25-Tisochrysis_lutea.AAC.1
MIKQKRGEWHCYGGKIKMCGNTCSAVCTFWPPHCQRSWFRSPRRGREGLATEAIVGTWIEEVRRLHHAREGLATEAIVGTWIEEVRRLMQTVPNKHCVDHVTSTGA